MTEAQSLDYIIQILTAGFPCLMYGLGFVAGLIR